MSKSVDSPLGTVDLLDEPAVVRKKISKAVTDTDGEVRYDPEHKPGLANLLELFSAATGRPIDDVAAGYDRYGPLKADLAEAVVELLVPVRERYLELMDDPTGLASRLELGAAKAASIAAPTLSRAKAAVGLLAR